MIILASESERRAALLKQIGLEFEIVRSNIDESLPENIPPDKAVSMLSREKAMYVCRSLHKNAVIIAADTIVFDNGKILGKPVDEQDAFLTLSSLSGKMHSVYTGLTVMKKLENNFLEKTIVDKANVFMRQMSDDEINEYVESGEPMDKAGSYGIQGKGAVFVEKIEGDFYTVVGLPLVKLHTLLGMYTR